MSVKGGWTTDASGIMDSASKEGGISAAFAAAAECIESKLLFPLFQIPKQQQWRLDPTGQVYAFGGGSRFPNVSDSLEKETNLNESSEYRNSCGGNSYGIQRRFSHFIIRGTLRQVLSPFSS